MKFIHYETKNKNEQRWDWGAVKIDERVGMRGKFSFHGRYLNNNMDIFSWGNVKYVNEDFTKIIISKTNSKAEYHIRLFDNYSLIDYKVIIKQSLNLKIS